MGMYDSVWVNCPKCETKNEFQSKSGDCYLIDYDLNNCPNDVLLDVNRHSPHKCVECGSLYEVDINRRKSILTKDKIGKSRNLTEQVVKIINDNSPELAAEEIIRLFVLGIECKCSKNITSCAFYEIGGKCNSLEYCKEQTT